MSTTSNSNAQTSAALKAALEASGLNQNDLADKIGASQPYVNQMLNGARPAAPEWLDLIAKAMNLSNKQRVTLHRAAARDKGFDIDL